MSDDGLEHDGLEHNAAVSRAALARLHEGAFRWALSLTGYDAPRAEDVMQQAYLLILEGRARYRERSALKTWLYGVVRNVARRQQRRRRSDLALVSRMSEAGMAAELATEGIDGTAEQRQLAVQGAVTRLPRRQREVLELVAYAELTVGEAAAVMGISIGSARTHYHRAKTVLRTELEADYS